jgi:cytochrome P450
MDPPRHTRLRKLVTLAFTRRRVDLLEPAIRALVASLLDDVEKQLAATGEADLITLFARPLPFTVICDLLGIPAEARARMAKYSTTDTPGKDYAAQARDVLACIRELIAGKRAEPADDLLTALIQARDDGERMTEGELTSMVQLLFVAGHETTVSLLANGIFAQLTDPDQFATDRDDPSRWSDAVEEILRFDGPVVTALPRFAAEPMEIAGRQIAGGDMVLISVLAANHDGARFDDPATLRLTRETAGHLSFGHGIHHCVGAPLARLQGRIALAAFAERFPDVRLAVEPDALRLEPSLIFNKLAALPIRRD